MAAWFRVVLCLICLVIALTLCETTSDDVSDHFSKRTSIIGQESLMSLGGSLDLSDSEEIVNEKLMKYKIENLDESFQEASHFLGSKHFFHIRDEIGKKPVFHFIRDMPKGAALHVHDGALVDVNYIIKNITYRDNLYMCYVDQKLKLEFMTPSQSENSNTCDWVLLKDYRFKTVNIEKFDQELRKYFTLWDTNPERAYPDVDIAWSKFQDIFYVLFPMITYEPVWRDFFYEALRYFYEDNVMYIEMRSVLPNLYDLKHQFEQIHTVQVLAEVVDEFKKNHPDFIGAKLIYAPPRASDRAELSKNIEFAYVLQNEFPNFFAGFDLVGREDVKPLIDFVEELSKIKNMSVFYHSGETNWYGFPTDYNLIDAVLFGAKRLGHAYALLKHPKVMDIVTNNQIALEINPISNQVLKLFDDYRNHPAASLLANNYPVVISSDDPGLWGALPLSHDFYITFNYIASRHADLRLLKQLAINSINFSSMTLNEKYQSLNKFNSKWAKFIDNIRNDYVSKDSIYFNLIDS